MMARFSQAPKSSPVSAKKAGSSRSSDSQDGALQQRLLKLEINGKTNGSTTEICPVCKSSRYLNANLRFLVNPECYHKMCESCVDRIFSHGPAPCPIPGCGKTLRKHRFRTQTFEDIQVEREVDIRRRIAAVFNKREEDFEDVRAFNDYLNEVEDITFNLVNNVDVDQTNTRMEAYQQAHQDEIEENATLLQEEKASYSALQKQEREAARLRREVARREEAQERREVAENKRDLIRALAAGSNAQDAEKMAKQGQQVQLKRRLDKQAAAERQRQLQSADASKPGASKILIKGLKVRKPAVVEGPVDPFGGINYDQPKYYHLQTEYVWDGVRETRKDSLVQAGGYDVRSFENRALCEAFGGLGVFVAGEATEQETRGRDQRAQSTNDDPF